MAQKYRLLHEIGEGGMGVVYEGRKILDQGHELPVAVKVMRSGLAPEAREQAAEMFRREGLTSLVVNHGHANLVTTFEYDTSATGQAFIVMELVDGISVDVARTASPLPLGVVRRIARDVLSALAHMHAHDVVHRDVTPANILLSRDGVVELADFGLVKDAHRSGSRVMRGTPEYASPEALHGQSLTGKADLYSLGVVLYELLAGHLPYEGSTPDRIAEAMLVEDPAPLPDDTPGELVELVHGLMRLGEVDESDPERFETAARALAWLDARPGDVAGAATLRALIAARTPDTPRRRRVLPALGWPFEPDTPKKRGASTWLGWAGIPVGFLLGLALFGLVFGDPGQARAPNGQAARTPTGTTPQVPAPQLESGPAPAPTSAGAPIASSEPMSAPATSEAPRPVAPRHNQKGARRATPDTRQAPGALVIFDAETSK